MENKSLQLSEPISDYDETTASWAVRYIHPTGGFQCILTLQATSGAEVLKKAEGALSYLAKAKCIPFSTESGTTENKDNGKNSGKTVLVKTDGDEKAVFCSLHRVEMQKWSKMGRSWYAHRWEDGWCHGK